MNTKLQNKVNILTLFVRSFDFLQGASLRPSEVVQVVRRAMDDWLATPQGSKRTTKTSFFPGEPANSGNLFLRNKPNFNYLNIIATSYITVVYDTSQTKPQNGANPNKPNLKPISTPPKTLTFIGEFRDSKKPFFGKQTQSKPNFKTKLLSVLLARRPVGVIIFTKTEETCNNMNKNVISANKIMKNKANFKDVNLAATSYNKRGYSAL